MAKTEKTEKVTDTVGNQDGSLGQNIAYSKVGSILTLTIDLSQSIGASASGKSDNKATTNGNVPLPWETGTQLGVNCFTRK